MAALTPLGAIAAVAAIDDTNRLFPDPISPQSTTVAQPLPGAADNNAVRPQPRALPVHRQSPQQSCTSVSS
jgi:hypothetical protein